MCEACLEMELYFSYLSEVEAKKQLEKQAAQPWQCEVTVLPQDDAAAPAEETTQAKNKSRFTCDEPE